MNGEYHARVKAEEQSVLITGLVDALVELYPDGTDSCNEEAYLAVLSQTQEAAHKLRTQIHNVNNSVDITPMSIIG